jgi:type IV secretory pathway VirB3-like protein
MPNLPDTLAVDHLALALTRPAMWMGVSIKLFFSNIVCCTLICLNAHTWLGVPIFAGWHCLMVHLSTKDPLFFFLWIKAWQYTPPVLNSWYWGHINSYQPG